MKTLVLIDMHLGGHHLMYLRLFSKILLELGYQVIVFNPDVDSLSRWLLASTPDNIARFRGYTIQEFWFWQHFPMKRLPQPFHVLARWYQARTLVGFASKEAGAPIDFVFFNWLDDYLSRYLSAWLIQSVFPFNWSGIWFLPRLSPSPLSATVKAKNQDQLCPALNAKYCRGVGVLDEKIAGQLQPKIAAQAICFPDITDAAAPDLTYPVVVQLRNYAGERTIIGLIGSLHKRKGFLTLLKTALFAANENWVFAFIGQLSLHSFTEAERAHIQAVIHSAPQNCFFHLEQIPDEPQFNAVIESCDILFAAYENFPYSSNILTKAAIFKKPIITSHGFCMGERVSKFAMGETIPEGNAAACYAAIRKMTQNPQSPEQPNFDLYLQEHGLERAKKCWQELLSVL
jgi:glycosyltransferase involved in cell wall biosynthesis